MGPPAPQSTTTLCLPAAALPRVLSTQLPVSAPPTLWVSVSSFSPWLSDFQTIWFSGCCGYFLFLNLLFFFWLCEEVMCIPTLPSWPEVRKIDILKFMNGNVNVWVYIEFVSFPSLLIFGHFILFLECMVIFPWLEDTAITNYKANLKLWMITFSCRDDLLFLWSCSQTGSKLHKPSLWLMSAKLNWVQCLWEFDYDLVNQLFLGYRLSGVFAETLECFEGSDLQFFDSQIQEIPKSSAQVSGHYVLCHWWISTSPERKDTIECPCHVKSCPFSLGSWPWVMVLLVFL